MPYERVVTNNLRQVMLNFSSNCLFRTVHITKHVSFLSKMA